MKSSFAKWFGCLVTVSALCSALHQVQGAHVHIDEFLVTYIRNYTEPKICPSGLAGHNARIVNVTIPRGESALYVLELANNYGFTASYNQFGYAIKQIEGVEESDTCEWVLYVESDMFPSFSPAVSVDQYIIPFTISNELVTMMKIIFHYEKRSNSPLKALVQPTKIGNINVLYNIQSWNSHCPRVNESILVTINNGDSILSVMEAAAKLNPKYEFIVDYNGHVKGYKAVSISGIANINQGLYCEWALFYTEHDQQKRQELHIGPSNFIITSSNVTVTYEMLYAPQ